MSPERLRKSPMETQRAAQVRHERAELRRGALVEKKMAKLARAQKDRDAARSAKASLCRQIVLCRLMLLRCSFIGRGKFGSALGCHTLAASLRLL